MHWGTQACLCASAKRADLVWLCLCRDAVILIFFLIAVQFYKKAHFIFFLTVLAILHFKCTSFSLSFILCHLLWSTMVWGLIPREGDPRTLSSSPSLHRTHEAAGDRVCVTKLPLPLHCWCAVISTCFGLLHNGRLCSRSSFISYLTGKTMELHQLEKQDPGAGEVVGRDTGPGETSVPMSPTGPHVSLQRGSSAPAAHTGVSGSAASLPAPSTISRRWICGLLLITAI